MTPQPDRNTRNTVGTRFHRVRDLSIWLRRRFDPGASNNSVRHKGLTAPNPPGRIAALPVIIILRSKD